MDESGGDSSFVEYSNYDASKPHSSKQRTTSQVKND
jgi:hypothetical protein